MLSWPPRFGYVPHRPLEPFQNRWRDLAAPDVAKNGAFTSSMQGKVKVSGARHHDAISLIA
ncbi:hypothetical protein CUJ84_pRLN3000556 (plasmid) [Rhizobium leguminosarum]|uniref:Uncharacterized protein n=1 Tax=Rhizobium leguminosarum TaxID=384 RepID=A0A2K9ZHG1_RHILE|nr:hypothetical protein CUJ84_pRLN3000556 [Rhizobium leguminosarum]